MGKKLRIPHPFFIQIPRASLEKIIENLQQIQSDIQKIEVLVEKGSTS